MGQVFLTVYDNKGRPVEAKTLVDGAGNDVINPRTGQPLVVPRDYDINAAIEFGRSLKIPRLPFNEDIIARELVRTYEDMYKAFQHGGPQDLQRSYNGKVGGGADEFVDAFKDAASFNLGVVGRAAGLSPDEIALGGGIFNWKNWRANPRLDTSGPFFNNPDNFKMIEEGIRGHDSERFFSQPSPKKEGAGSSTNADEKGTLDGRGYAVAPEQDATEQGEPRNASDFGDPNPPEPARQFGWAAGRPQPAASAAPTGLPQHVIDAGSLLRANGYEITPRTMYLAHVLGPQGAVDLIKRTGSTSSDAVPSPDAATGDQMRAWVRALRLGPDAPFAAPMRPASGTPNAPAPAQLAAPDMGVAPDTSNEDAGAPLFPLAQPIA
jgi:hypothetical protein